MILFPALPIVTVPADTAPFTFDHADRCEYRPTSDGPSLSAYLFATRGGLWKWTASWTYAEFEPETSNLHDETESKADAGGVILSLRSDY